MTRNLVILALMVALTVLIGYYSSAGDEATSTDHVASTALEQGRQAPPLVLEADQAPPVEERPVEHQSEQRPEDPRPPAGTAQGASCFHNRVMFQPVFCSKAPEVVAKALELSPSLQRGNWSIVHVGSRDAWLKAAEYFDVFGHKERGTAAIGRQLKSKGAANGDACGMCCDCASRGELRSFPTPLSLTLIDAPFQEGSRAALDLDVGRVVRAPLNDVALCPAALLSAVLDELSRGVGGIDVLTLDAWRCDIALIERLILAGPKLRPRLLDFTAVAAAASLEPLIEQLYREGGYHCFYITTKPEHKKFRGIRQPLYPIAIKLDGCWRPVYDSFRNDRYHVTCSLATDGVMSAVMASFSRMAHKGLHAGCSIPSRSARIQRLEAFLGEAA